MAAKKASKAAASAHAGRAVLVTTAHRGVFFGYVLGEVAKEQVRLARMRNVVSWDAATRGFIGLASTGPTDGCRITTAAGDESTLFDITSIVGVTDAARDRFEAGPWAR